MDINLNNVQASNPASTNNLTGTAAPQTEAQKSDQQVQRVTVAQESANLENNASNADEKRFEAIKSRATTFISGSNPFLNDIKFTIYGQSPIASQINKYEIRFTDLKTGQIEVKSEAELFAGTGGGDLVEGRV